MTKNTEAIYVPFSTIVKVLATLLFVGCLKILAPLLMTLFLAMLIAVSLHPVTVWLQKKGIKKSLSLIFVVVVMIAILAVIIELIVPPLFDEASNFISKLPEIRQHLKGMLSASNPARAALEQGLKQSTQITDVTPILVAGQTVLNGLTEIFLILVFSIYMLIDGNRVLNWFSAFFKSDVQAKIQKTSSEVSSIIFAYVAGQFITSLLSFLYVFGALSLLHVPSALLLATLSGVFDVLPVLGFFLAVVPAVIFGFSVSPTTAVEIFFLYGFYHSIENYLIVPYIYGNRLRVSGFVVLITLIAAGLLSGIEGAIAVLPVVASYPIIERIWLRKVVGASTISEHKKADWAVF